MKRKPLYLTLLLIALAPLVGCGGDQGADAPTIAEEDLAATVGSWQMTREQVYETIDNLPDQQKAKYDSHQGRAELTNAFIEEELWFQEALAVKLEEDPEIKELLEQTRRQLLLRSYFTKYIETDARPGDQEIHDYYDSHQDIYTTLEVARAQHVFAKNKEKLEKIKERVMEGGEKLTTMAHKYSEDKLTQADGGDLGYFNPGGYIRGVGYSETFSEAVFAMEPGKVYGPLKWEKGYSLIRVNEKRAAALRPYEEVSEEIATLLAKDRVDASKARFFATLSEKFGSRNYMDEYFKQVERSPLEMWNLAQATSAPQARLKMFQEIVDKFPDDEHAAQALFMVGFVYAEEMLDKVMADKMWSQLIYRYPDSEVAETAKWMIDNINEAMPEFESIEELNKKVQTD